MEREDLLKKQREHTLYPYEKIVFDGEDHCAMIYRQDALRAMEEYANQFKKAEPELPESTAIPDIKAKEFFEGLFDLSFLSEEERQSLYDAAELYAKGRVRFESTATVPDWKERDYNLFKSNFIAHADRLLRDRGASNKDVFECLELAFEDLKENIITPQAPKEVREVYLPVEAVDGKFPELEEFYICLLESEGGAVYEEKCWWNGKYFSYPSANYSITVTHWLKKVSLSLPKGECYEAIEIKDEKDLPTETDAYICILEKKEHGVRTEIASLMEYRTAYGQFHDNNDGFKVKTWFKPISLPIKEVEENLEPGASNSI